MHKRIVRIAEIATTKERRGLLPVSPATVWRWVREGKFPPPFKLGDSVTAWHLEEVEAFVAERAGSTN